MNPTDPTLEDPKKWTQARIAVALGVSRELVSDWLKFSITGTGKAKDARLSVSAADKAEIVNRSGDAMTRSKPFSKNKIPQRGFGELPTDTFDASIGLDDPRPFPTWVPTPEQIQAWATVIRLERWAKEVAGDMT